ncbi:MAG: DUF4142 domain-containing protein [Pedobacter sp.]|nr:DUF4142 domain-containing protein [Pedobacter sp.]
MDKHFRHLLVFGLAILSACQQSEKQSPENADSSQSKKDTLLTKTAAAKPLDTSTVSFFQQAAYGGMVEVESSNQILQHTKDPAIKTFAEMMVKDHGAANVQLKALAATNGYILPATLPNSKVDLISKMDTFKDEGRDEYYIQLMVTEHKNAIQLFSMASRSDDVAVAKFASTLLPTLNHHYQHTLKIDSAFKKAKANQGDDPLKLSDRKNK